MFHVTDGEKQTGFLRISCFDELSNEKTVVCIKNSMVSVLQQPTLCCFNRRSIIPRAKKDEAWRSKVVVTAKLKNDDSTVPASYLDLDGPTTVDQPIISGT